MSGIMMLKAGQPSPPLVSVANVTVTGPNGVQNVPVPSVVQLGSGSVSYSWSILSGLVGVSLSNATSSQCTLSANLTDQNRTGVVQLVVTDNGLAGRTFTTTADINITWGTPP